MNSSDLSIRPDDVNEVTAQLAALADRVRQLMDGEALNLTVEASARDEVSQRVAATLNQVHTSFAAASGHGEQRMRALVSTLQGHAGQLIAADDDLAV